MEWDLSASWPEPDLVNPHTSWPNRTSSTPRGKPTYPQPIINTRTGKLEHHARNRPSSLFVVSVVKTARNLLGHAERPRFRKEDGLSLFNHGGQLFGLCAVIPNDPKIINSID